MARRVQIAVIGAGTGPPDLLRAAQEVGARIAGAGAVLVCGGLKGVMGAAAAGAQRAGGLTVGILPSYDAGTADPAIDVVIPSGLGHARNVLVVAAADAVIALPGKHGTASEVAMALVLSRPVIALDAWRGMPGVEVRESIDEVVELALNAARRGF